MNFSVYNNLPIGQVYTGITPNVRPYTRTQRGSDNFSVNRELDRILDKRVLADMVSSNPAIAAILKSYNLRPVLNVENFKNTTYKHSIDTRNKAVGIYNYLPADLKSEADISYIQQGAMLHDIGKVLIPERILNKQGALSPEETEIMHLHSRLSSELLASQNISPEVLNIVKYHHQNRRNSGYPEIRNTIGGFDVNTEIVALADKYSALTEKRSYKNPLSAQDALNIIKHDVEEGKINPRIYNALAGYVNSISQTEEFGYQKTVA